MTDIRNLFYRLSDLPPPLGVLVRVIWDGRAPFLAARVAHPTTKRETWAVQEPDGRRVFLPLDEREACQSLRDAQAHGEPWQGWHTLLSPRPDLWAPRDPDRWSMPLPEPVVVDLSAPPRMVSERQRFGAVEEAEAADLAREMEADRETARAQNGSCETPLSHVKQWWTDVSEIRYEPPGEVSLKMAEGRVMRALAWCGAGQGLTLKSETVAAVLAELADVAAHAATVGDGIVPAFQPLPPDRDDFEVAMGWFVALNPPEFWSHRRKAWSLSKPQRVLLYRAKPLPRSFGDIGAACGWKGHQRASQVYGEAIEQCWRAANGMRVHRHLEVADQIAALRERNRSHKRGQHGESVQRHKVLGPALGEFSLKGVRLSGGQRSEIARQAAAHARGRDEYVNGEALAAVARNRKAGKRGT